jgi:hypothetical protein
MRETGGEGRKKEAGGRWVGVRREDKREEAAKRPRSGWKEAEEAILSARELRERSKWERETEEKRNRNERMRREMAWREGSEERREPEMRRRMRRESP